MHSQTLRHKEKEAKRNANTTTTTITKIGRRRRKKNERWTFVFGERKNEFCNSIEFVVVVVRVCTIMGCVSYYIMAVVRLINFELKSSLFYSCVKKKLSEEIVSFVMMMQANKASRDKPRRASRSLDSIISFFVCLYMCWQLQFFYLSLYNLVIVLAL